MPNWCEGTLKIRGTFDNLKNFILNGLRPVDAIGGTLPPLEIDTGENYISAIVRSALYMEHTRRHFCEPDYIELYTEEPDESIILMFPMKAAWEIEAESLLRLCKEFNVDMKIQGFERGMQFSQIIEIVNGEILQDDEIKYDDWDWDCPCPDLGG